MLVALPLHLLVVLSFAAAVEVVLPSCTTSSRTLPTVNSGVNVSCTSIAFSHVVASGSMTLNISISGMVTANPSSAKITVTISNMTVQAGSLFFSDNSHWEKILLRGTPSLSPSPCTSICYFVVYRMELSYSHSDPHYLKRLEKLMHSSHHVAPPAAQQQPQHRFHSREGLLRFIKSLLQPLYTDRRLTKENFISISKQTLHVIMSNHAYGGAAWSPSFVASALEMQLALLGIHQPFPQKTLVAIEGAGEKEPKKEHESEEVSTLLRGGGKAAVGSENEDPIKNHLALLRHRLASKVASYASTSSSSGAAAAAAAVAAAAAAAAQAQQQQQQQQRTPTTPPLNLPPATMPTLHPHPQ